MAHHVLLSAIDEEVWPEPPLKQKQPPDFRDAVRFSDFTLSGVLALPEAVGPLYEEINQLYGTDFEPGLP